MFMNVSMFSSEVSPLDRMRRRENVAALPAELQQMPRFAGDILHGPERQGLLHRQPPVEGEPSAIPFEQVIDIHNLRLEGVEAIQSDRDQVVEQLVHVAAAVYHHVFPGFSHAAVHPLQTGVDELPPEIVSHDQTDLLPPVVPEVDRVDVVFEGLVDLPQVVVADRVQQFVHESRVDVEVHQQVLDPAQFILASVTDSQFASSLIAVLIPVSNFCKDICRFADNLPVPGIFQNDRVSFVRFRIFGDTEPVSAKWI